MINHYTVTLRLDFHCHPDDLDKLNGMLTEAIDCVSHEDKDVCIVKLVPITKPSQLASSTECFLCDERFTDHIPESDEEMFL